MHRQHISHFWIKLNYRFNKWSVTTVRYVTWTGRYDKIMEIAVVLEEYKHWSISVQEI